MFFFNLSLGEFLILFTGASALVTALYLLDRSRRRVAVATLRFWTQAERPVASTRRRRIRQWGSLILQLLSIALLLLALSQLRLGSPDQVSQDHVLILDTSSWMGARVGNQSLMEQAKAQALAYVKAIPSTDRVLVLYADALATPVTSFESDRRKVEDAIKQARPGNAALDLKQAFDFAKRVETRSARRSGEIVFAGAGRTPESDEEIDAPPNLRVLPVKTPQNNVGLRKMGLRRSAADADLWNIYVSLRNYGAKDQNVELGLQFGGAPIGNRRLRVGPGKDEEAAFELRTRVAGPLEARIRAAGDSFPGDDRAVLELPALATVSVLVCSDEPGNLRPLLAAHPNVEAAYSPTANCPANSNATVGIYERMAPPPNKNQRQLIIDPPAGKSPIPIRARADNVALKRWHVDHPLGAGLRVSDLRLTNASVFAPGPGDTVIADSDAGPVMVARDKQHLAVIGFQPARLLRFELTTPLLFANTLRWLAPDSFRRWELYASSVGTISVPLDNESDATTARVYGANGAELPFAAEGKTLRFFAGNPGTVRVVTGDREQIYSLAIPAVPEQVWSVPGNARKGVPRPRSMPSSSRDIWYWLAAIGGVGLLIEWLKYAPRGGVTPTPGAGSAASNAEPEFLRRAS